MLQTNYLLKSSALILAAVLYILVSCLTAPDVFSNHDNLLQNLTGSDVTGSGSTLIYTSVSVGSIVVTFILISAKVYIPLLVHTFGHILQGFVSKPPSESKPPLALQYLPCRHGQNFHLQKSYI